MALGLVQFRTTKRYLGAAGATAPGERASWWPVAVFVAIVALLAVLALAGALRLNPVAISLGANWAMIALLAGYFVYLVGFAGLDRTERRRAWAMVALAAACVMFWAGYEQVGASFNLFADRHTERHVLGWLMPAGVLQAVNPLMIILFAPVFAALWVNLGRRMLEPSAPAKFVLQGQTVLPTWLVLTNLLHTFGELCLSPVGLSSMSKLAPPRFVGQILGVWFLATAIGVNLAGQFSGNIDPENVATMPSQFLYLFWWGLIGGIVMLALTPLIKRLMSGVK
jgi:POT family proton-dependent oligopeptide transporter